MLMVRHGAESLRAIIARQSVVSCNHMRPSFTATIVWAGSPRQINSRVAAKVLFELMVTVLPHYSKQLSPDVHGIEPHTTMNHRPQNSIATPRSSKVPIYTRQPVLMFCLPPMVPPHITVFRSLDRDNPGWLLPIFACESLYTAANVPPINALGEK